MPIEIGQHNLEVHANAEHWRRKPLLQKIYRDFYNEIASELRGDIPGATVEIGSGIGNFKTVVPEALATDIYAPAALVQKLGEKRYTNLRASRKALTTP